MTKAIFASGIPVVYHGRRRNPAFARGSVVLGLAGTLRQFDHAGDLADELDLRLPVARTVDDGPL